MEQQLEKVPFENSLIRDYSELPSQNPQELQDLYFDLNKRVLNMINDIEEEHLAKTQKLEELIEIVKTDPDVNKIENPQTNNVVMLGNKLNFNELNSSYSAEITTIPLGAEYPDTFISENDERGEIVMKDDIPAIEIIQSINNKLDDMRKESKQDILNLKNELKIDIEKSYVKIEKISEKINDVDIRTTAIETNLNYIKKDTDEIKTDINKMDNKIEKISGDVAAINVNMAGVVAINNKESIDKKNKWDRIFMFISIVVPCLAVFLIDKFVH